jgi:hypothetical protein
VISYTTFQDVINHGFDYLGGTPSEQTRRDCVRAALEAYRDLARPVSSNGTENWNKGSWLST